MILLYSRVIFIWKAFLSFLLSERTGDRNNNFKLIRFLASTLVIFGHSYALTGTQGEPLFSFGLSFGRIAVDVFFITSGFLVTGSFFARKKFLSFILARFLRIFPGLIVCILFCVFIVGLIYTDMPINLYLKNRSIYDFIFFNTALIYKPIQYFLPGVFGHNPYQFAVNGSLWTLPWEIKMYATLILIKALYFFRNKIINEILVKILIVSIAVVSTTFFLFYNYNEWGLPHHLLRFSSMFFMGSSFWVLKEKIFFSLKIWLLIILILCCSTYEVKLFLIMYNLFISYFIVWLAYGPRGFTLNFNLVGDYSYGLYIYAFPVQQSIAASVPGIGVYKMFIMSFVITLILSMMSWHFVENKALHLKAKF